jgi:ABC-type glycerol-3-phosphate transport system substrate-binding protein
MVTRRQLGSLALGATGAAALAACSGTSGSSSNKPASPRPSGAPDLKWTGTIKTGVQAYTPAVQGVKLAPGTAKLTAFGEAADAFTAMYPGIKIEFLGSDYKYDASQMPTQAAGGQLPDIWWQQYNIVNASFPKGVATNLLPYMQKPNPFIPGNTKWQDVFSDEIFNMTKVDDNTQYCNNGDFVGTAFFYNEDAFTKAGITAAPTTYPQLLDAAQKLKAAGITPSALPVFQTGYSWFSRLFLANFLGLDNLKKIDAFSKAKGISTSDVAVAWHQGIIDPRKNPAVLAWWPHAKDLYQTFDKSVTQLPKTPPAGSPNYETMFAGGKLGMVYDGTWLPTSVKSAGGSIKVGSFNWPSMAGIDQYATDYDSANSVGGPNAAWQFFVSSPKSDHTLQEQGKLDAVIAWMQFFTTPEWNTKIVNEYASFVPTLKGSKPLDSQKAIVDQLEKPLYAIQGGWEFTTETGDSLDALFQQFILGQVQFGQVQAKYVQIVEKGFNDYIKEHPIDFTKF